MNHNIIDTILYHNSFSRWKNNIHKIHDEFFKYFENDDGLLYVKTRDNLLFIEPSDLMENHVNINKWNSNFTDFYKICKLPAKYFYTSGKNNTYGYK